MAWAKVDREGFGIATMETIVVDLGVGLQLHVLIPNVLVGPTKVELGKESNEDILQQLQLMRELRLCFNGMESHSGHEH